MTYAELPDQTRAPFPRSFLFCPSCGGHYSANRLDYFWADPAAVITCGRSSIPLLLAREERRIVEVEF
jgi:hypothetical protein